MEQTPTTERITFDAAELQLPHHVVQWIANFDYVIVGEFHGSNEIPRLFGNIVSRVAEIRGAAMAGLEFPCADEEFLTAFSSSFDEHELAQISGFRNRSDDGRSSNAMFSLVERLVRTAGVRVFAFDADMTDSSITESERDAAMCANTFFQKRKNPRKTTNDGVPPNAPALILCGNIHSDKREGSFFDPAFRSLAWQLNEHAKANGETCLSISVEFGSGQTWCKTSKDCQPPVTWDFCEDPEEPDAKRGADAYFVRAADVSTNGHDAVIYIPQVTASPPYRD